MSLSQFLTHLIVRYSCLLSKISITTLPFISKYISVYGMLWLTMKCYENVMKCHYWLSPNLMLGGDWACQKVCRKCYKQKLGNYEGFANKWLVGNRAIGVTKFKRLVQYYPSIWRHSPSFSGRLGNWIFATQFIRLHSA